MSKKRYEECLKQFRDDIHWGTTLYPYNLDRYHILASDDTISVEHDVQRLTKFGRDAELDRLSTFDILVIAMAAELAYANGRENVCLLTGDDRMKRVADELRRRGEQDIVKKRVARTLDFPSWKRWAILPRVLDIFHDDTGRLPHKQLVY